MTPLVSWLQAASQAPRHNGKPLKDGELVARRALAAWIKRKARV